MGDTIQNSGGATHDWPKQWDLFKYEMKEWPASDTAPQEPRYIFREPGNEEEKTHKIRNLGIIPRKIERARPFLTQLENGIRVNYVDLSAPERQSMLTNFDQSKTHHVIPHVRRTRKRDSYFAAKFQIPKGTRLAFVAALMDSGATRHMASQATIRRMFGQNALEHLEDFNGICESAAGVKIDTLGILPVNMWLTASHFTKTTIVVNSDNREEMILGYPTLEDF